MAQIQLEVQTRVVCK